MYALCRLDPQLKGDGPKWLPLLTGICVFAYQTLDNMDGKQARRTGSSSALGMIFDHTCDAINAVVTTAAMGSVLALGWTPRMLFLFIMAYVPFYFEVWEEYYTGSMMLLSFNGPTEGLLMTVCICLVSYVVGPHWWHDTVSPLSVL